MTESTRLIGPPPEMAGTRSGRLLVVSTGWTLKSDLADYEGGGDVMAVNEAGMCLRKLDHWMTCHTEILPTWEAVRKARIPDGSDYVTHSKRGLKADVLWPFDGRTARTSGLTAVLIGILLGYDEIVLAGMPADNGGHYFPDIDREYYAGQEREWRLIGREHPGKVRSLSGNTKEWLEYGRAA